jgi:hypothetical protein
VRFWISSQTSFGDLSKTTRLIELDDLAGARTELLLGRAEAERLKDDDYVSLADDLLAQLRTKGQAEPL